MKQKILSLLVLLLTAATGAWAEDTYTITFSGFGNENCNKTITDATLEYSETFNVTDVYANYIMLGGVGGSNEYVSISKSQDETQITITVKSAFEGTVNVTVYYMNENFDESERNISVTCVKSAPSLAVTWDATTNSGTFAMPGYDVELTPIYAPAAQWATEGNEVLTPKAAEGIVAGTDAPLIVEGTVAAGQGTVMYFATTEQLTAEQAAQANGWLSTLPTAEGYDDATTVYVWYYIQGADTPDGQEATAENTFNDSEICATPIEVSLLSNKFDIAFNAANANTIESGKATVTVDGTDATVTDGKITDVKAGQTIILNAAQGYKFKKVEAKKTVKLLSITIGAVTVYYAEGESWANAIKRDENKDSGLFIREGNRVHHPDYGQLVDSNTQPVLPDDKIIATETYSIVK